MARAMAAICLEALGRRDEAHAMATELLELSPNFSVQRWRRCLHNPDRPDTAQSADMLKAAGYQRESGAMFEALVDPWSQLGLDLAYQSVEICAQGSAEAQHRDAMQLSCLRANPGCAITTALESMTAFGRTLPVRRRAERVCSASGAQPPVDVRCATSW
jgi:hypothetical protein